MGIEPTEDRSGPSAGFEVRRHHQTPSAPNVNLQFFLPRFNIKSVQIQKAGCGSLRAGEFVREKCDQFQVVRLRKQVNGLNHP